jgi:glycosyltransferase involved in cell wall biosynthesis
VYSFIVPAYNEAQHLPTTLRAIHSAAAALNEPYEIIVANDDSTDATRDIALAAGARVVDVRHRQIAGARNSGARVAEGDVFLFVDADTLISPELVLGVQRALQQGAVGGGAHVVFDGVVKWHYKPVMWLGTAASRVTRLAFGCFVFCTREAFNAVGGFDEKLYASEEIAFSRALKQQGDFVILRENVLTSARKLRAHSPREVWGALGHATLQMLGLSRGRRGLEAWYGARRRDPQAPL